jgi:hypothetical protein
MDMPDIYDLTFFNLPRTIKKYTVKYNIKENSAEVYIEDIMIECANIIHTNYSQPFEFKSLKKDIKYIVSTQIEPSLLSYISEGMGLEEYKVCYSKDIACRIDHYNTMTIYEMNYNLPCSINNIHVSYNYNNSRYKLVNRNHACSVYINVMRIYTKECIIPPTYINVDKMIFIKKIKMGQNIIIYLDMYKWNEYVVIILSDVYYNSNSYKSIKYNKKSKDFDDNIIQLTRPMFFYIEDPFISLPELDCYKYYITYCYLF